MRPRAHGESAVKMHVKRYEAETGGRLLGKMSHVYLEVRIVLSGTEKRLVERYDNRAIDHGNTSEGVKTDLGFDTSRLLGYHLKVHVDRLRHVPLLDMMLTNIAMSARAALKELIAIDEVVTDWEDEFVVSTEDGTLDALVETAPEWRRKE